MKNKYLIKLPKGSNKDFKTVTTYALKHWKPFLHYCPDLDFKAISLKDPEFKKCNCDKAKVEYIEQ